MRTRPLIRLAFVSALAVAVSGLPIRAPSSEPAAPQGSTKSDRAPETRAAGQIVRWNLVDHTGRNVSQDDFAGRFSLFVFGYTFCPDVCPTALSDVAIALDQLGERARYVVPIFVTIDPERDTPEVLAEYVANFHPRTVGLSGTQSQIDAVRNVFGVVSMPGPKSEDGSYLIAHSALKYLVGPGGEAIRTFSHDDAPEVIANYLMELFRRIGV